MARSKNIPVTWSALIAAEREPAEYGLGTIAHEVADLLSVKPTVPIAAEFAAFPSLFSCAAVVLGPVRCRPGLEQLLPVLSRVLVEFKNGIDDNDRVSPIGVLSFGNVAESCNVTAIGLDDELGRRWLNALEPHQAAFTEFERQTLALAALAYGDERLAEAFLDDTLSAPFKRAMVFGPSAHNFTLYMAQASRERRHGSDVEAAWLSFVDAFPRKLAANTLGWDDLAWAARTYYQRFCGMPRGTVMDSLHDLVHTD